MARAHRIAVLLALAALSLRVSAQPTFHVRSGDRVVFYGDSITEGRQYTSFIETFILTRFPNLDVSFVHSGWSGDSVGGGGGGPIDVRLQRDVLAFRPTVVTVMLGMNDGAVRPFDQARFDRFAAGYRHIVARLKEGAPGVRITAIVPSPYDDVTRPPSWEPGYNSVLVRFGQLVREVAAAEGLTVADLNTPVVAALRRAHAADPEGAARLIPDRVHPRPAVHLLMAGALLEAWRAPAIVSLVKINAARRLPVVSANTKVSDLVVTRRRVTWTQLDRALPLAVDAGDPTMALALKASNFVQRLNQQDLKFMNLPAARYALKIDGQPIGEFTRKQLVEGINLATLATPMTAQAARVHALTLEHNDVHFRRWRGVQVPAEKTRPPDLSLQLMELDAQEAALVRQQRATAQPVPHRYELTAL